MHLRVVGCSGSFPGPLSPASCYLIEHDGHRILLDLGSGALGDLGKYTDIYDIDAVFLSHLHADHCMDLTGYYVARKYRPEGPAPRIPVYGPQGTAGRMARGYDMAERPGMTNEFDFRDFGAKPVDIGPFSVTTVRVDHPVPAFGFRVEAAGKVLAYSGDTGPCDALVDLASGADLALFEASFLEGEQNPPHLHLTGKQAAAFAAHAGAGRLVATHLVPWHERERVLADAEGNGIDVTLAESGLLVEL